MAANPNKRIPGEIGWKQTNEGVNSGTVWSSNNIDLNMRAGSFMVSPRMLLSTSSADDADFGLPCAIKYFPTTRGNVWAIAGSKVFYAADGLNSLFTEEDGGVTPPTNCNINQSDLEYFNGYLYLTAASTTLYKLSSGAVWSALTSKLANSSGLHDLEFFRALNRLYFVDGNSTSIGSIDTSDTSATLGLQYTLNNLVDGTTQVISWIKSTSNRLYIGTLNYGGGNGYVYGWDGSQTTPNESYRLSSNGTLACVIKNDTPYILDTDGKLLALNGATFTGFDGKDYLAKFPFENKYFGSYFSTRSEAPVHYNGMNLIEGRINILLNSAPYDTGWPQSVSVENIPSGIWEYTTATGLYHKNSVGLTKAGVTIKDFGQKKLATVGALSYIKVPDNDFTPGTLNGSYMCGVGYYTDASTLATGAFYDDFNDTAQKSGYFVTPKIHSSDITDTFNSLFGRFDEFATDGDMMIIRYRGTTPASIEKTITWVSPTTFSTLDDVSSYIGFEVEVLQGVWAGNTAKILNVVISGAVFLVTIDQTFTGATGTAIARFQNWTQAVPYTGDKNYNSYPIVQTNTWIELRVFIIGRGKWEMKDLTLIKKAHQLAQ